MSDSSDNPYAVPKSDPSADGIDNSGYLGDIEYKRLKKRYNNSRSIRTAVYLLVICSVILLISLLGLHLVSVLAIPLLILFISTAVGLSLRTNWGRILGYISCVIFLFLVPIGTIISIFVLIALTTSSELFGKNKVTHKEAQRAFFIQRMRKKNN